MAVPEVIPINHEPDYRTGTIGRYADGQFLASITYAFPDGYRLREGWEDAKRLYTVLHRFDFDGHHTGSDIRPAGTWRQQQQSDARSSPAATAEAHLIELLDSLPKREYGDITIRPFQVTVDNVLFGLVIEQGHGPIEDEDDWAELYPDRLGFGPPWDGDYST